MRNIAALHNVYYGRFRKRKGCWFTSSGTLFRQPPSQRLSIQSFIPTAEVRQG